jgi:hypothetical protein
VHPDTKYTNRFSFSEISDRVHFEGDFPRILQECISPTGDVTGVHKAQEGVRQAGVVFVDQRPVFGVRPDHRPVVVAGRERV